MMTIISLQVFAQDMKMANLPIEETKSEENNAQNQYEIGMAFFYGDKVKEDVKKGIQWLEEAANQGHEKAMLNLTRAYMRGYKVRKSSRKAFQWATKAAEAGNAEAQFYLGNMYLKGDGCQANTKKGLALILEAKQQGYAKADEQWKKINELES